MRIIFLFSLILSSHYLAAQVVSGKINNDEGKAIAAASVSLQLASDSSIVKYAVTNKEGKFFFNRVEHGDYFITVTGAEMKPVNSAVFKVYHADVDLGIISLSKISANLREVLVQSKVPLFEVKAGKTIVHVEESTNAIGQNVLELLRVSPGVMVDKDDNISLNGKTGVQINLNGKIIPLSGEDLSAYLKSIQSSQIESIELINDPSSKYDAAGSGGIINIRLKKNKYFGTNGSVNVGYGIGKYPKYNAGFSLNYRNRKVNFYGTYNYSRNKGYYKVYQDREQLDSVFIQESVMKNTIQSNGYNLGMDYSLSRNSTIGFQLNGNTTGMDILIHSDISIYKNTSSSPEEFLYADNESTNNKFNTNYNLNYRFADTLGRELSIDAGYGRFRLRTNQYQPNFFYDNNQSYLRSLIYSMESPSNIDIYSGKADYEQGWMGGKLGAGFKVSFVRSYNDFKRFNVYGNLKEMDTLRSNDFLYEENINSFYLNYKKQVKGFLLEGGLRLENTNITATSSGYKALNGGVQNFDSVFNKKYTNLFPSVSVTYNKNPDMVWAISYSRRIDRPVYQDLNPFEFKVDEYTFKMGNTNLRPQFSDNISLRNTYKNKLTTQLGYSHIKDVISQLVDTIDGSKGFISKENLARQDMVNFGVSYPFSYKWYGFSINLNSYYSHYRANFGIGRKIDLEVFSVNANMQQSARLGKGFSIEVSGNFSSPTIWNGTFKSRDLWLVSAGMQKQFWNSKATLRLSVSDIFNSLKLVASSDFAGQYLYFVGRTESRQLKLNFSYRFGNKHLKTGGQRVTGVEEFSERVGGQSARDGMGN